MGTFRGVELTDLCLDGPRLHLRPWRADDAERVYEVMRDESMADFLVLPRPYTREHARAFVTGSGSGSGDEGRTEGTGLGAAVVERASGRVVGSCALRFAGDPEIGYWIASDAQGNGYAAEATRLLTAWGFTSGLPRIRLVCDVRNVASARTALAAGFAFEGVARHGVVGGGRSGVPERRGDLARFARLASDPGDPVPPTFARFPACGRSDEALTLRPTDPDDVTGLRETDDELTLKWSFDGIPHTETTARRASDEAGLNWLVGRVGMLSMIDRATGSYAGQVVLRLSGPPHVAGVGYVVHPRFRGRGYTTRALRLLSAWAFDTGGFARLELGAKVANIASQRAAVHAGFQAEGVFAGRLRAADGTYHDEARFALLDRPCRESAPQPSRISP